MEDEGKSYYHLRVVGDDGGADMEAAVVRLTEALELRDKYRDIRLQQHEEKKKRGSSFRSDRPYASPDAAALSVGDYTMGADGVVCYPSQKVKPVPYQHYVLDFRKLQEISEDGPCRSTCRSRLEILQQKFQFHQILNADLEEKCCTSLQHGGGIYGAMKVDNSVRLSTSMNPYRLLKFITDKAVNHGGDIVDVVDGENVTLTKFLDKWGIHNPHQLTVERLGLQPDAVERFHRFDIFSEKSSKGGASSVAILKLFLKRDRNYLEGRYYGELCQKVLIRDVKKHAGQVATQYKVPIMGSGPDEWHGLARWIKTHKLESPTNRWVIQIPRILELRNFLRCADQQEQLNNIFLPLWEASTKREGELFDLLRQVVAFNVISDESSRGQDLPDNRPPRQWPWKENPPDIYFNYYIYANVFALNQYRYEHGMGTFKIQPNCGEMGDTTHLVSSFLLADAISHGVRMVSNPVLQYLCYLKQVGIVCSPLANNALFLSYADNPFPLFFSRGLRVSLATDDPLHFHHTNEPIHEEYGTAAKLYKLSAVDLCEIARNSVLISGFDHASKQKWLGPDYMKGVAGNSLTHTRVPNIRLLFREEILKAEQRLLSVRYRIAMKAKGLPPVPSTILESSTDSKSPQVDVLENTLAHTDTEDVPFHRMEITGPDEYNTPNARAVPLIEQALTLRKKYHTQYTPDVWDHSKLPTLPVHEKHNYELKMVKGVAGLVHMKSGKCLFDVPSVQQFYHDLSKLHEFVEDVDVKTLAYSRLLLLECKFGMHGHLNTLIEEEYSILEHRDFFQSYKVDNNVHMDSGMTAKQIIQFFVDKAINHGEDVVMVDTYGEPKTLATLLREMEIDPRIVGLSQLNITQERSMEPTLFKEFGESEMRQLLLATDNYGNGRYFAEIISSTFAEYEWDSFTFAENRLSVTGRSRDEWQKLATWWNTYGVSSPHNRWLVQISDNYIRLKRYGHVESFQECLANIFLPLWEVTLDPTSSPILHQFLQTVSGLDLLGDEGAVDNPFNIRDPAQWTDQGNPNYQVWTYYLWANMTSLNLYRNAVGMPLLAFRPNCGKGGPARHLMAAFLTASGITHGLTLRDHPSLQYLYYLAQIPITMSPISNNEKGDVEYLASPLPVFFRRGLLVSLSSDRPLYLHHTQEPLVEEYSIASKLWMLGSADLCEMARNSVLQSGYTHDTKRNWVGDTYFLSSSIANDSKLTHLSDVRVAYRFETYHDEIHYLEAVVKNAFRITRSLLTRAEEDDILKRLGMRSRKVAVGRTPPDTSSIETTTTQDDDDRPATPLRADRESFLEDKIRELERKIHSLEALNRQTTTITTTVTNTIHAASDTDGEEDVGSHASSFHSYSSGTGNHLGLTKSYGRRTPTPASFSPKANITVINTPNINTSNVNIHQATPVAVGTGRTARVGEYTTGGESSPPPDASEFQTIFPPVGPDPEGDAEATPQTPSGSICCTLM